MCSEKDWYEDAYLDTLRKEEMRELETVRQESLYEEAYLDTLRDREEAIELETATRKSL